MNGNITVVIPAQQFNEKKYIDIYNCYLAEALRKAGYNEVVVSGFGKTRISGKTYLPEKGFSQPLLKGAFDRGEDVEVVLIPITNSVILSNLSE